MVLDKLVKVDQERNQFDAVFWLFESWLDDRVSVRMFFWGGADIYMWF